MFKITDIEQSDLKVGNLLIKVILPKSPMNVEYFSRYSFMEYLQDSLVDGYPIFIIKNIMTIIRIEKINKITGKESTSGIIEFFDEHYGILEKMPIHL